MSRWAVFDLATVRQWVRRPTARRLAMILVLTALWCGLWREISFANVAAGLVLSSIVLATGVSTPASGRLHLPSLVRLIFLVLGDLITSTVGVALEVIDPRDTTDEAIIAVEVDPAARDHLLLLVIAVTLTPGTAVVDADPDTGTLYLHLLHAERRPDVENHVQRLVELAALALPSPLPADVAADEAAAEDEDDEDSGDETGDAATASSDREATP